MKQPKIIGIQFYFQDEWVNTRHTLESLEKEAKECGGKLLRMYLGTSFFEHDTYYYMDCMGHTFLFRIIDESNKEYFEKAKEKESE